MTNPAAKKSLPAFLVLTIICLIAALALAATNAITKGPIQEHAMAAQREAFGAVMTADEYIEMTIPEGSGISALVEAKVNGETVGYCVVASTGGYAGPVAVTLGVDLDGKVTGAKIGDTSFAETSGFGSRWLAENQTEQFVGIDLKEGGAIEALSGATVTSTAVLNASNTALAAVNGILGIERTEPVLVFGVAEKKPVEQMALTGDIHEGSAKGFASDVKVQLTMDASGAITGLAIESSGETAGFGTRCMEDPAFAEQFVGKTAPFAIGENIDALAGATVTSTAVVAAVNAAVEAPANPDAVPFGSESTEETPAVEASTTPVEGALTAAAPGFGGADVGVSVTLNEDGTIATITIDNSKQVPPVCDMVNDEAFLGQFIGKKGPFTEADIVAGATFTSEGVINALNSLFPAESEVPAVEEPAADTLTAAAPGFGGADVGVSVTLNEDGTIATITIDNSKQVPPVCDMVNDEAFLAQFIGKKGPFTEADIVAGATFTSEGVINALNSLFPAADEVPADVEAPVVEEPVADAPAADTLTAAAPGFGGADVGVSVTLNEDGTIATMTLDLSKQLPPVCDLCNGEEFLGQFIGKKGPFTEADIVAGATFTSEGVINALNTLFPAENEVPAAEVVPVVEEPAADTLAAAAPGFGGADVGVSVTLNEDGTIATMTLDLSKQLPPVCDLCNGEEFLGQFIGKKGPFTEADIVAGATFTSEGVINALNTLFPAENEVPAAEEAPVGNVMEASVPGFGGGDVSIVITLDENGAVLALEVDASTQTSGIGTKCAEEAFTSQFVGKTGPFTLGEGIDAAASATVTSQAVVDAVNSVYPTQDMSIAGEEAAAFDPASELTKTVAAFGGQDVTITLTVDENGTVSALAVDASTQSPGLGKKCAEDEFVGQFVGQAGPFVLGENVDAVSYATITSEAVVNAVNELLGK